jgi:HlyD family type I secretion membrane fusion protein
MNSPVSHATFAPIPIPLSNRPDPRSVADFGVRRRLALAAATMALLVFGVGGWAVSAQLAGAVVSPGVVVVDRYVKRVQHRDGGTIAALYVKNGDRVEEGATLVMLDGTQIRADLGIIVSQLMELEARAARLKAENEQANSIAFPASLAKWPGVSDIMAGEEHLFNENRKTRESQKQQLRERMVQLGHEAEGFAVQRDAKKKELVLIERELDKVEQLANQGLTPQTRVYSLQREQARIAGEHGNLISQGARVAGQVEELKMQILTIDQSARTDAQRELRTVEPRIAELKERRISTEDKLNHLEIKAPSNGIVHEMTAHTIGGVVTPAEPIMSIVPEKEVLSVELKIAPGDIDRVSVGQEARLKFTSFNQRTTPELTGSVSYLSADVSHDPKGRQDYYTARVTFEAANLPSVAGKSVVPGTPVEAFLTTDKRTALSFLMKPVEDQFSRAFRER